MQEFNIEKIHNTVWIFKNAIKNPQDIIDYYENNIEWKDWYTFGKVSSNPNAGYSFESFPTREAWQKKVQDKLIEDNEQKNKDIKVQIDNLFYDMTSLYLEENPIDVDNWIYGGWDLAKYFSRSIEESPMAMAFHTDFQREQADAPGTKFGVTAVFYLNDNYTGGEVCYRFFDPNDISIVVENFNYKPSAGDVAIFLSGHPHYHGVNTVTEGEKYIIRTYWRYYQDGSPKWRELEEKYGSEVFQQMEKDRRTYNFHNNLSVNDIQVFMDIEEYYNKFENNELENWKQQ